MSFPAVLPLLKSSPVPPSRRARALALDRLASQGAVLVSAAEAEPPDGEALHVAQALRRLFVAGVAEWERPARLLELAHPSGVGAAMALLELADVSVESLADLVDLLTFRAFSTGTLGHDAYLGAMATAWALRGDGHRRLGQPVQAEAAFEMAFELLAGSDDAAANGRVEDLFARHERARAAFGPAIEGFERALGAFDRAGSQVAAVDTAVRLVATTCEAGRPEDAAQPLARLRRAQDRYFVALALQREITDLFANGRFTAASLVTAAAERGLAGLITPWMLHELAVLRGEGDESVGASFSPGSTRKKSMAALGRLLCQATAAERHTPRVATCLNELWHLEQQEGRCLPEDLFIPLVFFARTASPPAAHRRDSRRVH